MSKAFDQFMEWFDKHAGEFEIVPHGDFIRHKISMDMECESCCPLVAWAIDAFGVHLSNDDCVNRTFIWTGMTTEESTAIANAADNDGYYKVAQSIRKRFEKKIRESA